MYNSKSLFHIAKNCKVVTKSDDIVLLCAVEQNNMVVTLHIAVVSCDVLS